MPPRLARAMHRAPVMCVRKSHGNSSPRGVRRSGKVGPSIRAAGPRATAPPGSGQHVPVAGVGMAGRAAAEQGLLPIPRLAAVG